MTVPSNHVGDFVVSGNLSSGSLTVPADAIDRDAAFKSSQNFNAGLFQKAIFFRERFGLAITGTAVATEVGLFSAHNAGTLQWVAALCWVDGTGGSPANVISFDLKKNASSILSAAIAVNESTGNRVLVTGTFSSATYVAGDDFSVQITVAGSGGTQAVGPLFQLLTHENA